MSMNLSPPQLVDLRTKLVHWYGTDIAFSHESAAEADTAMQGTARRIQDATGLPQQVSYGKAYQVPRQVVMMS